MRIIDFHTHCYTDALAERAMRKLSESGGIAYYHDGTVRGWCKPRPKRASSFRS